MILTYKYRLKDSSNTWLSVKSRAVNFVWNYCNETSVKAIGSDSRWLSGYDLSNLTSGSSKEVNLNSTTIQSICVEYATRRKQFKRKKLRWRTRKSLGWIPFKSSAIKIIGDKVTYNNETIRFWNSREIKGKIKSGSFNQDARGRWYINLAVEVEDLEESPDNDVGIDLGLKELATLSNGTKYKANRYYRKYERLLKLAQKDGKKKRTKNIHAKIANSRRDNNHKISNEIARNNNLIVIGDVSSSKLVKTKMAKSVLDAGWSQLKSFLKYKAIRHSGLYIEVSEYLTSQTCSRCNCVPSSSPKGLKGLGIREWVCSICKSIHDRDINAAMNILRIGHDSLALK